MSDVQRVWDMIADSPNPLVAGVRLAVALVRGTPTDLGENRKVRM